ncbi:MULTISPECIES: transglycosylase SLT domain-containing protein [Alphaproteobacteria]|jgi:soluble lytic murein transglycosylase-like protein|uniref:lytic transglycosylase domain-containing protein n=1 Tax=Alphaproteobacteria TaxID=28211 RepID=UPI000C55EDB3|nr:MULTISPECIES: transglycosylase SLT domain-containing protein [Alphaproteobacteria]MBS88268.1 lytic transglycosylase [Sphingobium sp.]TAJ30769.1 MAG: lytic transglycosylase domain-containing protein [Bosea sp. (in: a-proteobacteria)]
MTMKVLLIGGIAIASAMPANAQDLPTPDAPEQHASPSHGIRIAEASNGFQLVEHGFWQSEQAAPAPSSSVAENGRVNLPYRYEPKAKTAPSGFRRASYLPHVYAAEAKYSLPTGLLDALVWTESRYNPLAVSPAGAAGLGQLMPATAKELGVSNRFDPMANVFGAARYLRQMLDRFGVVHLAVAAYNAGPGAVERAGGIPRNGETPGYVRDVLRHWRF